MSERSGSGRVRIRIADGVADVRLSRPEKRNALGGGLQVALGADIRIVAPDARLSVMEIQWGLIPDMTGTQLLPELVGRDVAKELTFTGRVVNGEEAVAIGLATRTATDPLAAALALATEIADRSPHAIRAAKRLLDMAGRVDLAAGFAAEQSEIGSQRSEHRGSVPRAAPASLPRLRADWPSRRTSSAPPRPPRRRLSHHRC